jgi:hypothetical protein
MYRLVTRTSGGDDAMRRGVVLDGSARGVVAIVLVRHG